MFKTLQEVEILDADLDALMQLFWKKGYKETTLNDIKEIFNNHWEVVFSRYPSKRDLFDLAFKHYLKVNYHFMKQFLENRPSVREGFRQLMIFGVEESITDPESKGCFVMNSIVELIPGDEELMMMFLENKNYVQNIFYEHLRSGVEKGEIRAELDLKATAAFLYNNYSGIKMLSKIDKDRRNLYRIINTTMKVLD